MSSKASDVMIVIVQLSRVSSQHSPQSSVEVMPGGETREVEGGEGRGAAAAETVGAAVRLLTAPVRHTSPLSDGHHHQAAHTAGPGPGLPHLHHLHHQAGPEPAAGLLPPALQQAAGLPVLGPGQLPQPQAQRVRGQSKTRGQFHFQSGLRCGLQPQSVSA